MCFCVWFDYFFIVYGIGCYFFFGNFCEMEKRKKFLSLVINYVDFKNVVFMCILILIVIVLGLMEG